MKSKVQKDLFLRKFALKQHFLLSPFFDTHKKKIQLVCTSRFRNSCFISNKSRSVYHRFRCSRIVFRKAALINSLPGVYKGSVLSLCGGMVDTVDSKSIVFKTYWFKSS